MARRSRKPVAVGDILARLLDEATGTSEVSPRRGASGVSRVLTAFGRIGPPVTDHADAVHFRRGVLTLQVHESAWLTELTFLRTELIRRINKMLGGEPVREVRLRLGNRRKPSPPPPPPPRPLTDEENETVTRWTAVIQDDAVRDAVRRAAARSMIRGPVVIPKVSGPAGPRMTPADPPEAERGLRYGYGDRQGKERAGWTKDRWKSR
ncbi:MAG: DUF721 domain-containing protein [Myxococcota bacterium]